MPARRSASPARGRSRASVLAAVAAAEKKRRARTQEVLERARSRSPARENDDALVSEALALVDEARRLYRAKPTMARKLNLELVLVHQSKARTPEGFLSKARPIVSAMHEYSGIYGGAKTLPKKAAKQVKKTTRRKKAKETYASYIYKVLKQVHPETGTWRPFSHPAGISKKAMVIMNNFVCDIYSRIVQEAGMIAMANNKSTLSSREIQTATRLVLPGELAKHAVSEGTKAVTKFTSA